MIKIWWSGPRNLFTWVLLILCGRKIQLLTHRLLSYLSSESRVGLCYSDRRRLGLHLYSILPVMDERQAGFDCSIKQVKLCSQRKMCRFHRWCQICAQIYSVWSSVVRLDCFLPAGFCLMWNRLCGFGLTPLLVSTGTMEETSRCNRWDTKSLTSNDGTLHLYYSVPQLQFWSILYRIFRIVCQKSDSILWNCSLHL